MDDGSSIMERLQSKNLIFHCVPRSRSNLDLALSDLLGACLGDSELYVLKRFLNKNFAKSLLNEVFGKDVGGRRTSLINWKNALAPLRAAIRPIAA